MNKCQLIIVLLLLLFQLLQGQQCTADAYQRCLCSSASPYCPCASLTPTNALNFSTSYSSHLILVAGQGCRPCSFNCLKCSSMTVCTQCQQAFELKSGQCLPCPLNCALCSNGVCSTCINEYYLDYQTNCQSCPITGTDVCTITSLISCKSNYWLDKNAANCIQCDPNCQQSSSTTKCSSCLSGFYLLLDYSCAPCMAQCSTCSSSDSCLTCLNASLYFDSTLKVCTSGQIDGCLIYSSSVSCSVCDNTSYLNSSGKCDMVSSSNLISSCATYMLLGNGSLICKNCTPGYFNTTGSCKYGCSLLCTTCYGPHYGLCYGCRANSKLHNLHCLPSFNIQGGSAFQLYYAAFSSPSFFYGGSSRLTDSCIPETVYGSSSKIWVFLLNLQSYKLKVAWKVYLYNFNQTVSNSIYNVTFSNADISEKEQFVAEKTVGTCYGNTLSLADKRQVTFNNILSNNSLIFEQFSGLIAVSELFIIGYRCGGIQGAECLECSSTSHCTKCVNSNYYISGYTCVQACPSTYYLRVATKTCLSSCSQGTYPNHADLLCLQCLSPCFSCTSDSTCLSCLDSYYLLQSSCLSDCPSGYYADSFRKSCQSCLRPCLTCLSNLKCLSCIYGFYKQSSNSCVLSCGSGFYGNISARICQACFFPCSSCHPYIGSQCLSCRGGFALYDSECLEECPSGYYLLPGATSESKCLLCDTSCNSCQSGATNCTSCRLGRYLFSNECFEECPAFYFSNRISNQCTSCPLYCQICLNQAQCLSCSNSSYLYQFNDSCLKQCPDGSFGSNAKCLSCQLPCLTCLSQNKCLSCNGLFYFNFTCQAICPPSTFRDAFSMNCQVCNISACAECSQNENYCTKCSQNLILFESSCLRQCPSQYYYSPISKSCLPCNENCLNCLNQTYCLNCVQNYVLSGVACSKDCGSSYYASNTSNGLTCVLCDSKCSTCSFVNETYECTSCNNGFVLSNKLCISSCAVFQYSYLSECFSCSYPCSACLSESVCQGCQQNFGSYFNGSCLTSCPLGYYSQSQTCLKCSLNCLKCQIDNTTCTSCLVGTYFQLSTCVKACSEGYYLSSISNICRKCSSVCKQCTITPYHCIACFDSTNLLINGDCFPSCLSGFYLYNGSCFSCPLSCTTCLNSTYCHTCAFGHFMSIGHSCSLVCSLGFYGFSGLCRKCSYPCKTCIDSRTCLSCQTGYFYNNNCYWVCPSSTYLNSSSLRCQTCSDKCSECLSSQQCLQCIEGVLVNGKCQSNCPATYYSYYSICAPCMYGCQNCSDSNSCLQCNIGFLYQGLCLTICPSGWVNSVGVKICQKCIQNCLKCIIQPSQCVTCINGLFLYIFACVNLCPEGTYKDYASSSCITCKSPCSTCQNGYSCSSCIYGYILYSQPSGNQCIEGPYCPNSFYLDLQSNQCVYQCPLTLYIEPIKATCSKPCPDTYVLLPSNLTCLQNCPQGMWIDEKYECQWDNAPLILPRFSCTAFILRNLLIIDCTFNIEISNLNQVSSANFSIEGMRISQLIHVSNKELRLVLSQPSMGYKSVYLEVKLNYRYQLKANFNETKQRLLIAQTGGIPVQNTYSRVYLKQYQAYSKEQRRTGLQLMQMSQSVCVGALIFWLLAILKNLKATSLTFVITLQWLYSLSFVETFHAPNFGQFLEGFRFANLFFSAYAFESSLWTLPNSFRPALWGVINLFSFQAVILPSLLLCGCFGMLFLLTHLIYRRLQSNEQESESRGNEKKAEQGSEQKQEPSLISNVPSKRGSARKSKESSAKCMKEQKDPEGQQTNQELRRASFSLKQSKIKDQEQWELTKQKWAEKCKILNNRFYFNYCFHLLLLTASPMSIAFCCQLIAPNTLALAFSSLMLIFYVCVAVGWGRWTVGEARMFNSSKFSLLSWLQLLILNGMAVLATMQIYVGVSVLIFIANIYVWNRVFNSPRQQKSKLFHQLVQLLKGLILLEALVAYTKRSQWQPHLLYSYSWVLIITVILLIIVVAVQSTKQFFDSEPLLTANVQKLSQGSGEPSKKSDELQSFVFSGSERGESGEDLERDEVFFSEEEMVSDSQSSEDIIDFDERGEDVGIPKELLKIQKQNN